MTLYLTAAPNRLAQARAATAQLAHAAYRIGRAPICWQRPSRRRCGAA